MKQKIGTIEMVTFKIKDGVSEEHAQTALESLSDCVKAYDGFLGRKLSLNDSGQWLDLVYWTDKEAANNASKQIMQNPAALEVFDIIDEASMEMKHYDVQSQFLSN